MDNINVENQLKIKEYLDYDLQIEIQDNGPEAFCLYKEAFSSYKKLSDKMAMSGIAMSGIAMSGDNIITIKSSLKDNAKYSKSFPKCEKHEQAEIKGLLKSIFNWDEEFAVEKTSIRNPRHLAGVMPLPIGWQCGRGLNCDRARPPFNDEINGFLEQIRFYYDRSYKMKMPFSEKLNEAINNDPKNHSEVYFGYFHSFEEYVQQNFLGCFLDNTNNIHNLNNLTFREYLLFIKNTVIPTRRTDIIYYLDNNKYRELSDSATDIWNCSCKNNQR